jgi:hypothetical protein
LLPDFDFECEFEEELDPLPDPLPELEEEQL